MSKYESGLQLLSRLNQRPSLANLNPILFTEDGPLPNEYIEITGSGGSGKSLLVMDLLARCILPQHFKGTHFPGKNCGAVIINTDHQFDLFRLIEVMEVLIRRWNMPCGVSRVNLDVLIKLSLKNLTVLNCYDSQQFHMTLLNLEKILTEDTRIGLIAIDSLSSYYWEYRLNNGIVSFKTYYTKVLEHLQNIIKSSNVIVVFTRASTDVTLDVCSKIILNECNNKFEAHIIYKNSQKTLPYKISHTINFLI